MPSGIDVFISSTCYDLADLRAVLADHLTAHGFSVRMSEDAGSAFHVDPTDDSIASCLNNVEASRAIVCIIDRRYGGVLRSGPHAGKSATHAEIEHARALGKPIFFFVREAAWNEWQHLRDNPAMATRWVEPDDAEQRERWAKLVGQVARYPKHEDWSNWCDTFKSAVDLRSLVLRRLTTEFPEYAGTLAMRADRMVRIVFVNGGGDGGTVTGNLRNVGVGPALNLTCGVAVGPRLSTGTNVSVVGRRGGLPDGDYWENRQNFYPITFSLQKWASEPIKLYCQYSNRFGDRYRLELPFEKHDGSWNMTGLEELYVWQGERKSGKWVRQELYDID